MLSANNLLRWRPSGGREQRGSVQKGANWDVRDGLMRTNPVLP